MGEGREGGDRPGYRECKKMDNHQSMVAATAPAHSLHCSSYFILLSAMDIQALSMQKAKLLRPPVSPQNSHRTTVSISCLRPLWCHHPHPHPPPVKSESPGLATALAAQVQVAQSVDLDPAFHIHFHYHRVITINCYHFCLRCEFPSTTLLVRFCQPRASSQLQATHRRPENLPWHEAHLSSDSRRSVLLPFTGRGWAAGFNAWARSNRQDLWKESRGCRIGKLWRIVFSVTLTVVQKAKPPGIANKQSFSLT